MVSSRDRSHSQRRDSVVSTIARTSPPAFLFPNQRCQRPDRLSPAPLFSAGGRRRRLSSCRPFRCQSVLSDFFADPGFPRNSRNLAQKPLRGCQGKPLKLRSDSIELREDSRFLAKIKWLSPARFSRRRDPAPRGRRLSSWRSPTCQRPFAEPSRKCSKPLFDKDPPHPPFL